MSAVRYTLAGCLVVVALSILLAADAGPTPECIVRDGGTPDCGTLAKDAEPTSLQRLKPPAPPPEVLKHAEQLEGLIRDARKGAKKFKGD